MTKVSLLFVSMSVSASASAMAASRMAALPSDAHNFRIAHIRRTEQHASKPSETCEKDDNGIEHCVTFGGSTASGPAVEVTVSYDSSENTPDYGNPESYVPANDGEAVFTFNASAFSAAALKNLSANSEKLTVKQGSYERVLDEDRSSSCGTDMNGDTVPCSDVHAVFACHQT